VTNGEARQGFEELIAWMQETDMAVVVSQGQNEIAEMSEKGLDIRPHRKRMVDEDMETEKVKAVARELLTTLKQSKLVLDWRKRQQARAEVRVTIEKLLDQGLPRVYTPVLFEQKTTAVYQHIYDACYGAGRSVYAAA
jgi:hypothetical protein